MNNTTELDKIKILRHSNKEASNITKKCIEVAFLSLLKEKNIDDISITDIVKKAGVSRTAYYRNFKSKDEILRIYMNQIIYNVAEAMKNLKSNKNKTAWLIILEFLEPHLQYFKPIIKINSSDKILYAMKEEIKKYIPITNNPFYLSKICGEIYSVFYDWAMYYDTLSAKEVAKMCEKELNFL